MNRNYDGTISDLTYPLKNIYDCGEVIEKLRQCSVECNVSPQETVICRSDKCCTEKGCNIKITNLEKNDIEKKVWIPLKNRFELDCAELIIHGYYIGCIRDFIRKSNCPFSR
jgi:hypothetical protein